MKKYERVNDNRYFNEIINTSPYFKNKYFVVHYKEHENYNFHIGIAVGKKVGNAVLRNRLKRIVRDICTKNRFIFKNNTDYIIIVKKTCIKEKYQILTDSLISLLQEKEKK